MANNPIKLLQDSSTIYPEEANLIILRHPNLETDERFLELKSILLQFFKDRRKPPEKQSMHREMTMRWKESLYNSLQRLLSELSRTHDPDQQEKLLSKVHSWYRSRVTMLPPAVSSLPKLEKRRAETPEPSSASSYVPAVSRSVIDSLNSRYLECRKRENYTFKRLQAKNFMITSWERTKAKISGERARRMEQTKLNAFKSEQTFTKYEDSANNVHDFRKNYDPESPSSPNSEINEDKAFVSKIAQVRHMHQELIDVEARPRTLPRNINSSAMSLYSTPEKYPANRSFERSKSPALQREMYDQVIASKNKLAQKKIACPMQNLENGLLLPEVPLPDVVTPNLFPKGNEKLLSNPFPAKKKAKKGKKGKKRGRR